MGFFKEELGNVKAFVFDVDGVLSRDTSPLNEQGDPVRTANVKDGFAIRNAIAFGYPIAIITGGYIERVRFRYEKLGVKYYYDNVRDKVTCLNDFLGKIDVDAKNVMYMGDDLVDYQVMSLVGIPTCPKDAVQDIKELSKYISDKNGGEGCVRDVIEQTLRAQKNGLQKICCLIMHFNMDWFPKYNYILASKSPRRNQLLKSLGIEFQVIIKDVEEKYPENLTKEEIPVFLAELKAQAFLAELKENDLIITADTIVWLNGKVLGKPKNKKEAIQMLQELSACQHQVISGVCLTSKEKQVSFFATSNVYFKQLTRKELEYYVSAFKPFDKAGAYGIQEWIGSIGISHIEGSFYNVMGLPIQRLYEEIQKF